METTIFGDVVQIIKKGSGGQYEKSTLVIRFAAALTVPSGVGAAGRLFPDQPVSNIAGVGNTTDPQLLNPGGFPFFPAKISGSPTTTVGLHAL